MPEINLPLLLHPATLNSVACFEHTMLPTKLLGT